jgi:hypothetical protein|nr:MAG TPA: putative tail fiber protein [Caudoviricetes sp.]
MNKAHSAINWENYPSDETPVNERNLNKMDGSIDIIDDRVITLDTTKATKAEVATLVADVTFEESTGIITITKKNGSKITIDTQMEKIAINFDYNPTTQQIILTLIDGTKQYIDLSALITQYEFLDSDTVAFYIDKDGKVSAIVKEGSIEEKHLEPNYLAKIKVEVAKAESSMKNAATSENNAASSATKAQSYAVGGTGSRESEDSDNAKYYSEQAKAIYGEMQKEQVTGVKGATQAEYQNGNVELKLENFIQKSGFINAYTNSSYRFCGNVDDLKSGNCGIYWVYTGEATGTQPISNGYYALEVICPNGGVTIQKAYTFNASRTYYRMYTNDRWYDWTKASVTGVKGDNETEYRYGNVNLTPENIGAVPTGGDTAENTTAFTAAPARENLKSGEKHNILFGKIAKWFADLKAVAFSGSYNDLSNKPTIPTVINNNTTTVAGYALDARQANPNVSGSMAAQMKSNYEPKLQIVSAASTAAGLGAGATRTDTIIITIPTGYSFTGFVICDYNNNSGKTLTTIQTVTVSGSNVTVLVLLYNTSSGKSNTLARVKALMVKNI